MSQKLTYEQELEIIDLFTKDFSQKEICHKLHHGGNQVSRTLKAERIADVLRIHRVTSEWKDTLLSLEKEEKNMWKFGAILLFIGHILVIVTSFIY